MCGETKNSDSKKPSYGDYVCRSLDCKSLGSKHGESWCGNEGLEDNGKSKDLDKFPNLLLVFANTFWDSNDIDTIILG